MSEEKLIIDGIPLIEKINNWRNKDFADSEEYTDRAICDVLDSVIEMIYDTEPMQPQGIDKDRLIETFTGWRDVYNDNSKGYTLMQSVIEEIQAQPTTDGWIPVTYHETTEEEKEVYGEECPYILDCPMPDVDTEILVCTKNGNVFVDFACCDEGWYVESGLDFVDDIVAWQPLPQPYKESE